MIEENKKAREASLERERETTPSSFLVLCFIRVLLKRSCRVCPEKEIIKHNHVCCCLTFVCYANVSWLLLHLKTVPHTHTHVHTLTWHTHMYTQLASFYNMLFLCILRLNPVPTSYVFRTRVFSCIFGGREEIIMFSWKLVQSTGNASESKRSSWKPTWGNAIGRDNFHHTGKNHLFSFVIFAIFIELVEIVFSRSCSLQNCLF